MKQHYTDHNKLVFQCVCNRARWTAHSDWGETPEKKIKVVDVFAETGLIN